MSYLEPGRPDQTQPLTGPPVYWVPPPYPVVGPAKSRTPMWTALLLLALLVGMLAGGGTVWLLRKPAGTAAAVGPSASPSTSPTPTAYTGTLRALFLLAPDDAQTGSVFYRPLTIDSIANTFADPDHARQVLRNSGFQEAGYAGWTAGGLDVYIEIYRFDLPEAARSFEFYISDLYAADATFVDHSPVAGVDGSSLYVSRVPNKVADNRYTGHAFAARGQLYLSVYVAGTTKAIDPAVPADLAKRQYDQLPS
jgi:hypothetical protein